jgi:hypothetical protein
MKVFKFYFSSLIFADCQEQEEWLDLLRMKIFAQFRHKQE